MPHVMRLIHGALVWCPVILAGGQGNRCDPFTPQHPKPLLPVGTFPLLYYQLKLLEQSGFTGALNSCIIIMLKILNCGGASYPWHVTEALVITEKQMSAAVQSYFNDTYITYGVIKVHHYPSDIISNHQVKHEHAPV
jgi:hypothetical protein